MGSGQPGQSTPCQTGAGLTVEIVRRSPLWARGRVSARTLADAARAAFSAAGGDHDGEVALVLSSDEEVQALNRTWRGADRATNVLAFPAGPAMGAGEADPALGEVVLAYQTLAREAEAAGISVLQHACHLVVHGLLHLLGYDHHNDEAAAEMEGLESEILTGLGHPDPYRVRAGQHVLEQ